MKFSVILPTFHRPDDVEAFLESMKNQEFKDFEIIIGDGSHDDSVKNVVDKFKEKLNITFLYEKGIKASEARNLACEKSTGEFLVFIDSDCIVPSHYFSSIVDFLNKNEGVVAFGGSDAAHESFTPVQKAINYAMTSVFTTGGIRGKKTSIDKFHLRGFNMAVRRDIFFELNGFSKMQVAEDIDFSMRLYKAGYKAHYIHEAYVYHKRRDTLGKFRRQLTMHGKGRIDLFIRHKESLKFVYFFPFFFIIYLIAGIFSIVVNQFIFYMFLASIVLYTLVIFIDALIQYKSLNVALLSIYASYVMLVSYGYGFFYNFVKRIIIGKDTDTEKKMILRM